MGRIAWRSVVLCVYSVKAQGGTDHRLFLRWNSFAMMRMQAELKNNFRIKK